MAEFISSNGLIYCSVEASFFQPPVHMDCSGQANIKFMKCTYRAVPFSRSSNLRAHLQELFWGYMVPILLSQSLFCGWASDAL